MHVFWLVLATPDGFKLRVRTVQLSRGTSPRSIFLPAVVYTQSRGVDSRKSLTAADSFKDVKLGRVPSNTKNRAGREALGPPLNAANAAPANVFYFIISVY